MKNAAEEREAGFEPSLLADPFLELVQSGESLSGRTRQSQLLSNSLGHGAQERLRIADTQTSEEVFHVRLCGRRQLGRKCLLHDRFRLEPLNNDEPVLRIDR
jgi:hypothetical protein